ncbi:rhomboid family protein [bacterium BMS3Abin07]|nr:rhomboid family protein [bacterium BMS3Abin07]GBE33175.1 rhomboid family protein [bacterium BMS3Bbin05]HDL19757.1 rhomboid family intramembrane serine protease [Nitrospirota bacterium]HDO22999.1 rhomboid family intramembrane serine protease [Nitrospirota bacterium]HDZ87607.1 rhomboid family intramembrane serine protease [Nitrospirota bacterium]
MIPYKDDNPAETFPFVTIGIVVLNVLAFIAEYLNPGGMKYVVYKYGAIPSEMLSFRIGAILNVFYSMFLHGGFFHIAGNMLYLWIFGNNIEDRLGHLRFAVFYLLCGVVAAFGHALSAPSASIPMIGASGAISGILGAYLLLYPHAKVHTLIFFGFFVQIVRLPAVFVIGFWAVIQLVNAIISKGMLNQGGGVAWFAHIGGFLFGLIMIRFWIPKRRPS